MKTFAILLLGLLTSVSFAQTAVTVTLDPSKAGAAVPDDYLGFSYEMQLVLPDSDGKHLLRPDNTALANLYKQLGIKNIRVGGNTSDVPTVPVPNEADIDSLFAFAKLAGANVDYTLRARGTTDFTPGTKIAKYLYDHYKSQLVYIAIGNEPNVYAKEYPTYHDYFQKYSAAVNAPDVAPDVLFGGPGTTPGKAAWASQFAKDFGPTGKIKFITQHAYPGNSARKVTDPAVARKDMLSTQWVQDYQKFYDAFAPAANDAKVAYRLEEANSYFHGGAKDASNTLASALWGLDFMHWWAAHGCAGINFHTGDKVAAGDNLTPCWYASYWTSDKGYNVHPLGYAIKAFDIGGKGQVVPAQLDAKINLTAYGILAADKSLYVTLINKDSSDAKVALSAGSFGHADAMFLKGPDLAATTDVTFGDSSIGDDAAWSGKWTPLASAASVDLPAATAVVVKLTR